MERKNKDNAEGILDNLGFYRTPNGSFWDADGEYFNRHGYDVNGGYYSKDIEYIPGPDWLSDIGCYPDEKGKYENDNFDEWEDEPEGEQDDFKGDFEDDDGEDQDFGISPEELKKLQLVDEKLLEKYKKELGLDKPKAKAKSKNKSKASKIKKEEEESWETVEDDEEDNHELNK